MLTAERVRELLHYDPNTGALSWRNRTGKCGSLNKYWRVAVDGRLYLAHRLIWLHVHGHWPAAWIDHINGDQSDNRLVNLREATASQNTAYSRPRSNGTGYRGVRIRTRDSRATPYVAVIGVNQKRIYSGYHATAIEAARAYDQLAIKHFGEFAVLNFPEARQ